MEGSDTTDTPFPWDRVAPRPFRRVEEYAEDWTTGPPDFVGVGAQRCGTTRWYRLICAHPEVTPAPAKEMHFFGPRLGEPTSPAASYADCFPRAPDTITGEWTPRYMLDPWTAPLLAEAAPRARLLISLRDPLERFLSGLRHRHRREQEGARALDAGTTIEQLARSQYVTQLDHLLEEFDRSQVMLLQYEKCVAQPRRELRRTYAHLGVDPDFQPKTLSRVVGRTQMKMNLPERQRRALIAYLAPSVQSLAERYPELDLAAWPNFSHLA